MEEWLEATGKQLATNDQISNTQRLVSVVTLILLSSDYISSIKEEMAIAYLKFMALSPIEEEFEFLKSLIEEKYR